jgi:Holliday junction DNA helicase RuvA
VIASLTGVLREKAIQRIVIDVGGVGYDVQVPLSTLYTVGEVGAPVSLRVHTHVREDAIQLFGFATALELVLFERLIGVNGIGPKLALAVLSGIETSELVRAVQQGDLARLTTIPGVGKKTGERLIIELRDRLPTSATMPELAASEAPGDDVRSDVLSALTNLGYQRAATERIVDRVLRRVETHEFEGILREVLKELTR